MQKCLIVAIADNNGIGVRGGLPWHLPQDLKYFKEKTSGYPVIMGRTTYFSIGRPLPGRTNIVLNLGGEPIEGVHCVNSFDEAYSIAESAGKDKCFIIGGASVYKAAMPEMDLLYITHVHTVVEDADTFFPQIDNNLWTIKEKSQTFTDEKSGFSFEFVVYERRLVR